MMPTRLKPNLVPLGDRRARPLPLLAAYQGEATPIFGPFIPSLLKPLGPALRAGLARGFAALAGGRTLGVICHSRYSDIARISLLHVAQEARGLGLEEMLLAATMADLGQPGQGRLRVVCEAMVVSHPDPDEVFRGQGFEVVAREILSAPLGPASPPRPGRDDGWGFRGDGEWKVRGWQDGDAAEAALVLRNANLGTEDGLIYPELVDRNQVVAAVNSIMRGSCGRFDTAASSIAESRRGGFVAGLTMCTRNTPQAAFITEVAVDPAWQGRGIGTALLDRSLARLAAANLKRVSLGVTVANTRARGIYASRGFGRPAAFGSYYLSD